MPNQKNTSLSAFLLALACAALLIFFVPMWNLSDLLISRKTLLTNSKIVVLGNSVIDHVSKCDASNKTISTLLQDIAGEPVTDLSSSGQYLNESILYAGISLFNKNITDIVLTVSAASVTDNWTPSLQRALFFKAVAPKFINLNLEARLHSTLGVTGEDSISHDGFTYRNTRYPNYDQIKAKFLQVEKDYMPCPENDGKNSEFITAYYFHNYAQRSVNQAYLDMILNLHKIARRRDKTVHIIIMPVDMKFVTQITPESRITLENNINIMREFFKENNIPFEDLSFSLENSAFADRWCACGHLLDEGRVAVSVAIRQAISTQRRTEQMGHRATPLDAVSR